MNKFFYGAMAAVVLTGSVLTGCSDVDKDFSSDYVAGVMDASYKGEFSHYMNMTDSTEEDASEIYESTIDFYTESIAYYCEVYTDDISEELHNEFRDTAKAILSNAKYTISSAENGKESCYVKVAIKPINILEQCEDDIQKCIDDYNARTEENLTDEEIENLENDYARNVLDVLKANIPNMEYKDNIDFTMEIRKDEENLYYPANENDWNTIDNYVMGLY